MYYNPESKLANGFIRAGHHVMCFSDRDHARESTILNTQKLGKTKMEAKLLDTAEHYQPHLILFGHTELLQQKTYNQIREKVKGVKLATFCVDAVFCHKTMAAFKSRAEMCDAAFITTADEQALAALGIPGEKLHFLPNAVDNSIETARIFDIPRTQLTLDGQFLGNCLGMRKKQLMYIEKNLPQNYRFYHGGQGLGVKHYTSTQFLSKLCEAPVSLNLPRDDTVSEMMPYLYSSDRIAQLLGQGVTALSPAKSKLSDLYEDGIVEYNNRDDLIEKMVELYENDGLRRRIGKLGHRIAHTKTNATKVAKTIISNVFNCGT